MADHPQYDAVRKIWNGMHDKHPALIARCADVRDVGHAVTFARETGDPAGRAGRRP
jgi:hypothetical protein